MTIYSHSVFFLSENQRMQNKFHSPTSCIQRASHISCDLSYSPEIILVSHNHTSNTPYVQFGYSSFEKLINVILRCNCISSKNNYLQYFVPGKASTGIINNTSTLFSSILMGPIQHPSSVRVLQLFSVGARQNLMIIHHECGACARMPNNKHSPSLFTQYCKDRGRTNFS